MSRDYTEITDEQLRAINKRAVEQPSYEQLREQNRVLRQALRVAVFVDGPDTVQPEFERWSALVDEGLRQNFNEWYGVQVLVALTATSQPGGTHEL